MRRRLFIPPVIGDVVYQAVSGVSGVQFLDATSCPACSGLLISHDLKQRRFSTVQTPHGTGHIYVYVKRFHCRECGRLCYADAPFYDKSRFGSPLVDLCITLARSYTYSQTATILENIGIIIDRGTVRKTALMYDHEVETVDFFGVFIPRSVLSLSALVMGSDTTKPVSGRDVLEACGFPVFS
jgi:hypothetical protein